MTPAELALKWMGGTQTERAAAQEHFIDLCRMLSVPTPNEDPTGAGYAFEKGAEKVGGGSHEQEPWEETTALRGTPSCDLLQGAAAGAGGASGGRH
jgi:hypothetical protein